MRTLVKLSVVAVVSCLFWGTTSAFEGERGVPGGSQVRKHAAQGRHGVAHEFLIAELREALALTDQQAEAIAQEEKDFRMTSGQMREQIDKLEYETYQIAGTGDAAAVGQVVLQRINLQKQLEVAAKAFNERINAILTPEQQDKLKQMQEESHKLRHRRPHQPEFEGQESHQETEREL